MKTVIVLLSSLFLSYSLSANVPMGRWNVGTKYTVNEIEHTVKLKVSYPDQASQARELENKGYQCSLVRESWVKCRALIPQGPSRVEARLDEKVGIRSIETLGGHPIEFVSEPTRIEIESRAPQLTILNVTQDIRVRGASATNYRIYQLFRDSNPTIEKIELPGSLWLIYEPSPSDRLLLPLTLSFSLGNETWQYFVMSELIPSE